jgi:hypothetical protein
MEDDMITISRQEYEILVFRANKYVEVGKKGNEWKKQNKNKMITEEKRNKRNAYQREWNQRKKSEKSIISSC